MKKDEDNYPYATMSSISLLIIISGMLIPVLTLLKVGGII